MQDINRANIIFYPPNGALQFPVNPINFRIKLIIKYEAKTNTKPIAAEMAIFLPVAINPGEPPETSIKIPPTIIAIIAIGVAIYKTINE